MTPAQRGEWNPLHRGVRRLRQSLTGDLNLRIDHLRGSIDSLREDIHRLDAHLDALEAGLQARLQAVEAEAARSSEIARHAFEDEPANRRRLHALRASDEYELAFREDEPLVSFLIPRYDSYETLRDVALPSVLGQTHSNVEVIVVGDGAPPETEKAIASVDDPRITYYNRTIRSPYPDDPDRRWVRRRHPSLQRGAVAGARPLDRRARRRRRRPPHPH